MKASYSRHPGAEWATGFVRRVLLNSASVRLYSAAPYLAELYRPDLSERIRHPAEVGDRSCASPLALLLGGKTYFIPGSAEDLILYVSSVVACAAAIARALPAEAEEDYGPPTRNALLRGEAGRQAELRAAWGRMNTETDRRLVRDRLWVVCSDIHDCIGTVNPDRLHGLLEEVGADRAALVHHARMQGIWSKAGCRGQTLQHVFQHGVGQPLLCEMLQTPLLRPMSLGLLRQLYGHHGWEMPGAKDLRRIQ